MQPKLHLKAIDVERLENTSPAVGLLLDPGAIQAADALGTWTCPDTATCCQTEPATCTCPDSTGCPSTYTCPPSHATMSGCSTHTCCCAITSCPNLPIRVGGALDRTVGVHLVEF